MTYTFKTKLHGFYRHISHLTGLPFYVGRAVQKITKTGLKRYPRAFEKGNRRTKAWQEIAAFGYDVEILMEDLTFDQVIAKEREFVKIYGKVENGGLLVNVKDGGEDGHEGFPCSEETKIKLSEQKTIPFDQKLSESIVYEENGCWTWRGPFHLGSPAIHLNKRTQSAKRVLYSHFNKVTVKRNQQVHSKCDNPLCVNPVHLEVHQASKAVRDKSPFNEEIVKDIKRAAYEGVTHHELANKYGVARTVITKITTGQTWGWVTVEGIPTTFESSYHKGKKKPVVCIETGKIYPSVKEASIDLFGTDEYLRYIRKVCNSGKYTFCKGYNFKFSEDGQGA